MFHDRHINPDRLPPDHGGFQDEWAEDFEAEVERTADGSILVHDIDPGFHESIEDDIHDHAADIFADCPTEPGRYLAEASYTFRYSGRHSANPAVRFRRLEVA